MTAKFQSRNLVYNRNTKEDGAIRKVYETNGAVIYEVAVPKNRDMWHQDSISRTGLKMFCSLPTICA